jgi:hypothetical protein
MAHGTGGNSIALAEGLSAFTWAGGTLTGGSGTAGQPTIFAVNQLYLACRTNTAGNPMATWSYNTGTGTIVDSSPIISLNGTQVAFISRNGAVAAWCLRPPPRETRVTRWHLRRGSAAPIARASRPA